MYYSPLRYPGGKAKLVQFMEFMINERGYAGGTYIEPFAGGAGILGGKCAWEKPHKQRVWRIITAYPL